MPNLNLKNFAKIKDSDFDIKDITVFAGKPGTGKSYIMKVLYGFDEVLSEFMTDARKIEGILKKFKIDYGDLKKFDFKDIENKLLGEILIEIDKSTKYLNKNEKESSIADKNIGKLVENMYKSIFGNMNQISNDFIISYKKEIVKYVDGNFSVNVKDDYILPENAVFVETPLVLEFKQFMNRQEGKTPYHIESLLKILDKDYSFTDEEQDDFIKSFVEKSRAIINGSIEDSGDSFIFRTDDNKPFDIVNASSGIKSIGLLQYLVTNKALKKGSVLYWEEPEVHLHPSWQLKMVDLFIELMNAGVKIVFSTHSPFMADYLNAKAQREKFNGRVSFNLLSEEDGIVKNDILNDNNWNLLQDELLGSLEDIMWQYL